MKPVLYFSIIFFSAILITAQNNDNFKKATEEVWNLEKDYISYFKNANHKEILSLWHNEFLGWPDSEVKPVEREIGRLFLEAKYSKPMDAVFKIIPEGIRVIGNVAINHYSLLISWIDEQGKKQQSESRITHTWIKINSNWKILGGMSSKK